MRSRPPYSYPIVLLFLLTRLAQSAIAAGLRPEARLGRAMDRPLWKCHVPGEALRRFFTPWFILTLGPMVIRNFQVQMTSPDAYFTIEMFMMLLGLLIVPVGACIMFSGALVWEELGETLAVIPRQFRLFLPVLAVSLVQYILQQAADDLLPRGLHAYRAFALTASLINVPMVLFDLLAFCMMWRICMLDRDTAHQRIDDLLDD